MKINQCPNCERETEEMKEFLRRELPGLYGYCCNETILCEEHKLLEKEAK